MKRFLATHEALFLVVSAAMGSVALAIISFTNTKASPLPMGALGTDKNLVLYSAFDGTNRGIKALSLFAGASSTASPFMGRSLPVDRQELYLSPDRKLIAVTNTATDESWPSTYISDLSGKPVTSAYSGQFISWAPDSGKVLLYLSPMERPWERKIYALDIQNKYYDTGLPNGTINADISPVDAGVLYSFTSGGTDNSTLYVRDAKGNDRVVLRGDNSIFALVRWSPRDNRIVYMKSDLLLSPGQQSVWMVNIDGTGAEKISDVDWGYPPVFSPDGLKMTFANAGVIAEYDMAAKSLKNVSASGQSGARHPSYSADGRSIIFSARNQIWSAREESVTQLTADGQEKDFPIMP